MQGEVGRLDRESQLVLVRRAEEELGVANGGGSGAILAEKERIWSETSLLAAQFAAFHARRSLSDPETSPIEGPTDLRGVKTLLEIASKSTGQDKPSPPVQFNLWQGGSGIA